MFKYIVHISARHTLHLCSVRFVERTDRTVMTANVRIVNPHTNIYNYQA